MVRRQTRVQKRNRRQKTKRNNRRQNKTLRRKRQSRRKLGGGNTNTTINLHPVRESSEDFRQLEENRLGLDEGEYKELEEKGKYKHSGIWNSYNTYENDLEFSVYQLLAKDMKVDAISDYIPAIDEAKVLNKSIDDYIKFKNPYSWRSKKIYLNSDQVDNKYLKELKKQLKKKRITIDDISSLDKFKKMKNEAKILDKTIDQYIDFYKTANTVDKTANTVDKTANTVDKTANTVDDLQRNVDKLMMKELNLVDEKYYEDLKNDAKLTGLTLHEVKEAIDKAEINENKDNLFAKKLDIDNNLYQKFKTSAENQNMSILNLKRIKMVEAIEKRREDRIKTYNLDFGPRRGRVAIRPSSHSSSSQAIRTATSVGMIR